MTVLDTTATKALLFLAHPGRAAGALSPLNLPNLYLAEFHLGYAAGADAAHAGVGVLSNDAPAGRWWRFGWLIGNDGVRERRSPAWIGQQLRAIGLPIGVNPWLRDTPSGLDFEEGWGRGGALVLA